MLFERRNEEMEAYKLKKLVAGKTEIFYVSEV